MTMVYELQFNNSARYIGITTNLNDRLAGHKSYWRKFKLTIKNVRILHSGSNDNCRKVERLLIAEDNTGTLLNKEYKTDGYENYSKLYGDILDPRELSERLERSNSKKKLLREQLTKLENRYISLYMDLERAKINLDSIEDIIEEAVYAEIRKDNY